jgi:hypothetical protein
LAGGFAGGAGEVEVEPEDENVLAFGPNRLYEQTTER